MKTVEMAETSSVQKKQFEESESLHKNAQKLRKVSCALVGARGYSGLELVKILLRHPHVDLRYLFATNSFCLEDYISVPNGRSLPQVLGEEYILDKNVDLIFLATPAEVSLKYAPALLERGSKVIDLSGAFRLAGGSYPQWYGFEHSAVSTLEKAVYGLVPFQKVDGEQNLISNPGCYATAVSLALIPVVKHNLIQLDSIVVDAKSGATGAGRRGQENLLFTEVAEECLPYKVGRHQHYPEIQMAVQRYAGQSVDFHFTTSLLAIRRGIIAGIYVKLVEGVTLADVERAFAAEYQQQPLIHWTSLQKTSALLSLKRVVGTARIHLSFQVEGERLYLFSCLDNLMKGAASQAVENFNRLYNFPVELGLHEKEALI